MIIPWFWIACSIIGYHMGLAHMVNFSEELWEDMIRKYDVPVSVPNPIHLDWVDYSLSAVMALGGPIDIVTIVIRELFCRRKPFRHILVWK